VHNLFSPLSTFTSHFHSPCPSSSLALYVHPFIPLSHLPYSQRLARATFFLVRNRNSATRRKRFRNRNSATF
jgi:hypothetical protein